MFTVEMIAAIVIIEVLVASTNFRSKTMNEVQKWGEDFKSSYETLEQSGSDLQ